MKLSRKLLPALALLLVSAVMITTATFAWFSMNQVATATGMQMEAEAEDNVLIVKDTDNHARAADTAFRNALVLNPPERASLRPVSSANGVNFYYVDAFRVNGGGATDATAFAPYVHSDTDAFNANYRTTGSVGYAEYSFQIMATNAGDAAQDLVINRLALTYGGSETVPTAFRVAVLAGEYDENGTAIADSNLTLKKILAPNSYTYTDSKAVNASGVLAALPTNGINNAFSLGNLAAGATKYYRVVVRIWLEGQDTTCTNKIFANLDDTWSLDLSVKLGSAGTDSVTALGNTKRTIPIAAGYTVGTAAQVIDSMTYYPVMNGTEQVVVAGDDYLYTTQNTGAFTTDTQFYTLTKVTTTVNSEDYVTYHYPTNVTPQCELVPAVVLTSAEAADATETNVTLGTDGEAETYYAITGKTFEGKQLYTTEAGALTSDSLVYTIVDDAAIDVTVYCTLPAPLATP